MSLTASQRALLYLYEDEGSVKIKSYFLGTGPHAAERVEVGDGTVQIRMFNGTIVGHGQTAEDAARHLADQLRTIARLVEGHEGGCSKGRP